jgi:hypothetical protein
MSPTKLIITPKTKVGELLDAYPWLESVLLELSPSFAKLRNPVLRKTVARVASLQQAAIVGGLKVDEMVNRLRREAGQEELGEDAGGGEDAAETRPEWLDASRITQHFDASPVINSGGSPMAEILSLTQTLKPGEIMELETPFVPAPIIDLLKGKDFRVYSLETDGMVKTYIKKP